MKKPDFNNEEERREWLTFGCLQADIDEAMEKPMFGTDPLMLAASILSDSQAVLEMGDAETARQFINRAKYIIFKERDKFYPHPSAKEEA